MIIAYYKKLDCLVLFFHSLLYYWGNVQSPGKKRHHGIPEESTARKGEIRVFDADNDEFNNFASSNKRSQECYLTVGL